MVNIQGLTFGYGRGALFNELALDLAPGNIYGLLGVNGAGKSTLLKLISGLLFASRGTVRALGQNPANRMPSFLLDVFLLPEDAQAPNMQAADYLRAKAPFYPRFDRAAFERYLREFELPSAGNLAALSHGQQKKFLLAFGLASQAKLVLLDEPTNGLDVMATRALRALMLRLRDAGHCILFSSHVMQEVTALCDEIVIVDKGRVVAGGTPEALRARFGSPTLEDAFVSAIGDARGLE